MFIQNIFFKIIILSAILIGLSLSIANRAESWSIYDSQDMKLSRQWQGLMGGNWSDWHIDYVNKIQKTHDARYKYTQRKGKGTYFKSGEIEYRPLVVWFAYKNGTISEPQLVYSSGSKRYDNFNIEVVRKTKVPAFPSNKNRVFMWDGEVKDLVKYLKYRGVFPSNYSLSSRISLNQIRWEKL